MKAKGISGMHKQTRKAMGAFVNGKRRSEFSLVFEDFMRSLGGFVAEDAGNPYYGKSLSVILEDIGRPEFLTSPSGERILLEDALGMDDWELVSEGFDLSAVKGAVRKVIRKVVDTFRAVLRKSMDAVQKFIEKLKANRVVSGIIAKYGLEQKAEAVKAGISFSRSGDTLKTVINRGKMREAFEAQAASLGAGAIQESACRLSFDDVVAEGLGDWLKKAKDGLSKAGTKLNSALSVDGAKRIGKAVADMAKGLKDKAVAKAKSVNWGRLAKACLAILAVGAIAAAVIAALSGEDVPQEEEEAPKGEEAQAPKLDKHYLIYYDKNGDGVVDDANGEEMLFETREEYEAKVKELTTGEKTFYAEMVEEVLDEDGSIIERSHSINDYRNENEVSDDEGSERSSVRERTDERSETSKQKIVYDDGSVMHKNLKTKEDFDLAAQLAMHNREDDFRDLSPEEKAERLKGFLAMPGDEEDGERAKAHILNFLKKHPELADKPGNEFAYQKWRENHESELRTTTRGAAANRGK